MGETSRKCEMKSTYSAIFQKDDSDSGENSVGAAVLGESGLWMAGDGLIMLGRIANPRSGLAVFR